MSSKRLLPNVMRLLVVPSLLGGAAAVVLCFVRRRASHGKQDDCGNAPAEPTTIRVDCAKLPDRSTTGTGTSKTKDLPTEFKTPLHVELVSKDDLVCRLSSRQCAATYKAALDLLLGLEVGTLIVIYDVKAGAKQKLVLPITPLNGLVDIFQAHAPKFLDGCKVCRAVEAIAKAFVSNPHDGLGVADKWACHVLNELAATLANLTGHPIARVKKQVMTLHEQPADGAFVVLSLRGTIVAANCKIDLLTNHRIVRPNEKGAGTRHHAGVAAVEWLQEHNLEGMALVRSDAGPVTAFFYEGEQILAQQVK